MKLNPTIHFLLRFLCLYCYYIEDFHGYFLYIFKYSSFKLIEYTNSIKMIDKTENQLFTIDELAFAIKNIFHFIQDT